MKLLHTSDWHLGRNLYGRKRTIEFRQFLDWLAETVNSQHIDILCVAGDIFDSTTPSNTVQSLYFSFLQKLVQTCCRKIIITGGNHDSPSLLEAPKSLLKSMNIEVIGRAAPVEEEIIPIYDNVNRLAALVCAVPYLRDQDIRFASPGETSDEKREKLIEGIKAHYQMIAQSISEILASQAVKIPVIGMGHLFAAGGKSVEGDGVRDLYVGTLAHVRGDDLPQIFDYLALGHLHVAQRVAGKNHWRYSGSPLAMNFSDSSKAKEVVIVTFEDCVPHIQAVAVPCFQNLISIKGNSSQVIDELNRLKKAGMSAWLEILLQEENATSSINEKLHSLVSDTELEILRIINQKLISGALVPVDAEETLEELSAEDVFVRCLNAHEIPSRLQPELLLRFREALAIIEAGDVTEEGASPA